MIAKKYKTLGLIALGIALGTLATAFILPRFTSTTSEAAVDAGERKVLFWYDPMYPATKFDKPGPSPFMDMDLVPKYADEGSDEVAGVTVSPTQVQNLGLRTDIAAMGQLTYQQSLPANVDFNQYQYEIVHARASGFVEKSYPLAVGDYVKQGDPLIDITVSDWVAAQSEYLTLLKTQAPAELLKGVRERLYLAGMPNELIEQLSKTRQIQSYLTIRAPISGVLTSFELRSGMTVSKAAIIATIQGIDPVWVVAAMPESLTDFITADTQLTVAAAALPGQHFEVQKWQVLSSAQENTRTLSLRLFVGNPDHLLKPGMSATVSLATKSQPYLLIPSQAIINTGDEQRVITQDGQGRFIPKQVKIYAEASGKTALLSGLQAGDKVVTSGLFLIDSEANINGALERMREQPAEHSNMATDQGAAQ
ncbi:Cu(I)/Ag(I) efflux system membrane fusion protein [Orbus hercynius]|uniref:Cu(I)/Ag(I) efflux system membrane fusion protein n=1 Tax=Orbus hercynius TaxID=593135 RepID=A0A495RCR9_9GAMM|nr:Cu(I)/Ag(I) efflux system membrane fusion protein [Orbus hercynius]